MTMEIVDEALSLSITVGTVLLAIIVLLKTIETHDFFTAIVGVLICCSVMLLNSRCDRLMKVKTT